MSRAAAGRDKRLASALRDNLRRRKQASRPEPGADAAPADAAGPHVAAEPQGGGNAAGRADAER